MVLWGLVILPSLVRPESAPTRHQTQNPGPKEKPTSPKKPPPKENLGTAVRRATLAADENRCEFSRVSRLPARTGDFSYRNTAPFPPQPPFPRPPVRPNGSFRDLYQKVNSQQQLVISSRCGHIACSLVVFTARDDAVKIAEIRYLTLPDHI
jgi:hypothetical protein